MAINKEDLTENFKVGLVFFKVGAFVPLVMSILLLWGNLYGMGLVKHQNQSVEYLSKVEAYVENIKAKGDRVVFGNLDKNGIHESFVTLYSYGDRTTPYIRAFVLIASIIITWAALIVGNTISHYLKESGKSNLDEHDRFNPIINLVSGVLLLVLVVLTGEFNFFLGYLWE